MEYSRKDCLTLYLQIVTEGHQLVVREGHNIDGTEKVHDLDILTKSKLSQACQFSQLRWNTSRKIAVHSFCFASIEAALNSNRGDTTL